MSNKKKGLILGITGQDGSYLAELLLEKGYDVHGVIRRHSNIKGAARIDHIMDDDNLSLHYGDITDSSAISRLIAEIQPDEIYNLAAQSHVKVSFDVPEYTAEVDGIGTLKVLEAIRAHCPTAKFYQASTSELYGKVQEVPQKETTPFYPRSPYGCAKIYWFWIVKNYRESYGLFACNGILFNHEGPRRGATFVTRKITRGLSAIKRGEQEILRVGNLEAKRDWGSAKDYVVGMWLMLQQDKPDDYVLATGETHSVREFIEEACKHVGFDLYWDKEDIDDEFEKGIDRNTGKVIVEIDPKYFRPTEVDLLIGDPTKAKKQLGWQPKISFDQLVKEMVASDLQNL